MKIVFEKDQDPEHMLRPGHVGDSHGDHKMNPVRIITVSSLYGGGGPEVAERSRRVWAGISWITNC